jgi:hypothetical protein
LFVDHPRIEAFGLISDLVNLDSISDIAVSFIRSGISIIFGYAIESRIYYSSIILLIGLSYFFFTKKLLNLFYLDKKKEIEKLITAGIIGVLSVINPFVLGRIVLGHDRLLLVFAIIPWIFYLLGKWSITQSIEIKALLKFISLSIIISIISVHMVPALIILCLIWIIINYRNILESKIKDQFLKLSRTSILISLISLVTLSLLLLVEIYFSFFKVKGIGGEDVYTWATTSDRFYDIFITTFSLNGLWLEKGLYLPTKNLFSEVWILSFLIIIFFSVLGFLFLKAKDKKHSQFIIITILIFGILSMGVNAKYNIISLPYRILYEFYFLRGLREPQKLQMFLTLSLLMLTSIAIFKLQSKSILRKSATYFLTLILILMMGAGFVDNANKQIFQCEYPGIILDSAKMIRFDEKTLIYPHQEREYYAFCEDRYTLNPFHNAIGSVHVYKNSIFEGDIYSAEEFLKYTRKNDIDHLIIAKRVGDDFSYLKSSCKYYFEDLDAVYCKLQ